MWTKCCLHSASASLSCPIPSVLSLSQTSPACPLSSGWIDDLNIQEELRVSVLYLERDFGQVTSSLRICILISEITIIHIR